MLKLTNIHKTFNEGTPFENIIFHGFNLTVEEGSALAIIGPNGCGKSTLMNLIGGSLMADEGEIRIDDTRVEKMNEQKRSRYLGRVYQNPSMGVSPSLTILENMALADNKSGSFNLTGLIRKERIEHYRDLLRTLNLGLEDMMESRVSLLSGGQRQSLSLIMAGMNRPKLLLLDEHTASLDPKTSKVVMEKTRELINKAKMTTIMITHNMRDAVSYSDRVIMLTGGEIVLDEKSERISEDDLNNLYKLNAMAV